MEARALDYLRRGYQRLLTFEVPGGGFSLYGAAPADPWLSAYGLMQFHDLSRVLPVDDAVIQRTWDYLRLRSKLFDRGGAASREGTEAYALWAVAEAGRDVPGLADARLEALMREGSSYARLLAVNALSTLRPANAANRETLDKLLSEPGTAPDADIGATLSSARGNGARAELLALALIALDKTGQGGGHELADRLGALRHPNGGWSGTQATVLALKALVGRAAGSECDGEVVVASEGVELARLRVASGAGAAGVETELPLPPTERLQLRYAGTGRLSYTLTARAELPWRDEEADLDRMGLRRKLALPDGNAFRPGRETVMEAVLTNRGEAARNPMVALGLGAAFEASEAGLDALLSQSGLGLMRHERRGNTIILYFDRLDAGESRNPKGRFYYQLLCLSEWLSMIVT